MTSVRKRRHLNRRKRVEIRTGRILDAAVANLGIYLAGYG